MNLTILHTNDMHGRVDGLARIASVVERIRAETPHPVVWMDAGDIEETTSRLSNITKGVAMHELLGAAGCEVATVGNAAWLRYGPGVLRDHAASARYPLLLANLRPVTGPVEAVLLPVGELTLGVIGVTAPYTNFLERFDYGIEAVDEVDVVRRLARSLRDGGADLVVVLSHLGLDVPEETVDDRRLARALQGEVELVVGGHSHDVLAEGERVGDVLIVQAGAYGEHVGRVDVVAGTLSATVEAVAEDTPPHPAVLAEIERVEHDAAAFLDEVIGELPQALDQAAAATWLAGILRERMQADVGLVTDGVAFDAGLDGGPLRRGGLWDVCPSPGNPAVATLTGEQLQRMLERGRDPELVLPAPRSLRGRPLGLLRVDGFDEVDRGRTYRVAATDWELGPLGGLVEAAWDLDVRYDVPIILREAIEEHLAGRNGRP